MYLDKTKQYKGNKAQVGSTVVIDDGHHESIGVFVGYCPDCKYKVVMSRDAARQFSAKYKMRQKTAKQKLLNGAINGSYKQTRDYERQRERQRLEEKLMRLDLDAA